MLSYFDCNRAYIMESQIFYDLTRYEKINITHKIATNFIII